MSIAVPQRLRSNAAKTAERAAWLVRLPQVVASLAERWNLLLGDPFDSDDVSAAWAAPATRQGEPVVLKLGMPHMEAEHEIDGLRFWDGGPLVRLLDADDSLGAMLLERCVPGTTVRLLPEEEQDRVVARLLRRMWERDGPTAAFRPLSHMIDAWSAESRAQSEHWPDAGLAEHGLQLLSELARPTPNDVLLHTDLHAGNVLRAEREPWLVIDPKPFVGDPAYDATQHLIDCAERVISDPRWTVTRFAHLLGVDAERVRMWLFARVSAEPRDVWSDRWVRLARALRP